MNTETNLNIKDFIKRKQESKSHLDEEIQSFIKNLKSFTQDEITQWLKSVKLNGLNDKETSALTLAMANSGTILNWEGLEPLIDKHSTGGIGDKITLLYAPLIAAYGINIPKLSGRSLGITGGTIDKLESIPGFRTNLNIEEIKSQVKKIGLAIAGTSSNLAPADKVLYSIRDVTNTVDSIPLIASSIMSKKIAGGATNIILDVKFGSGAFMKSLEDARLLASTMVKIGNSLKRNTRAVISDMNQPLGYSIGNALEIKEVIDVLSGKEVSDLIEVVISLAIESIKIIEGKVELSLEKKLLDLLLKGQALKKFEEMVLEQKGDLKTFCKSNKKTAFIETIKAENEGYIQNIDARILGEEVHKLGAGRKLVSDSIDHSVGVVLFKKYGNKVNNHEPLLEIHAKKNKDAENAKNKLISAITIAHNTPPKLKLVQEIIK